MNKLKTIVNCTVIYLASTMKHVGLDDLVELALVEVGPVRGAGSQLVQVQQNKVGVEARLPVRRGPTQLRRRV